MSDADDQMGGEPPPQSNQDDDDKNRPNSGHSAEDKDVDEASKESFPASDPPANY